VLRRHLEADGDTAGGFAYFFGDAAEVAYTVKVGKP